MGDFKTGLLVGVLGTAVVALGIAVAVLVADDSGERSSDAVLGKVDPERSAAARGGAEGSDEVCLTDSEIEIDLRTSGLNCAEARDIYLSLKKRNAIQIGLDISDLERERGWACVEHPLVAHPLRVHCSKPGRRFLLLSLGPTPHSEGAPPPPEPPPGSKIECGDLAEGGAGTYNVVANGANCFTARQMAGLWQEICFGPDPGPNPCPVIDGFSCISTEIGIELVTIQCIGGRRVVSFESGA